MSNHPTTPASCALTPPRQAPVLACVLDTLCRAEGLRNGVSIPKVETSSPATAGEIAASTTENGLGRRGLSNVSESFGAKGNVNLRRRRNRVLQEKEHTVGVTSTAGNIVTAEHEELKLLRRAVELEDGLGYDEPPLLPVPVRIYLGTALLRGLARDESLVTKEAAKEAEDVFRELETRYLNIGRKNAVGSLAGMFSPGKTRCRPRVPAAIPH